MVKRIDSNKQRLKRHVRVRAKISGTAARPRLCVYRSNANISAQIIDDERGVTLVSASTLEASFEGIGSNKEAAKNGLQGRFGYVPKCSRKAAVIGKHVIKLQNVPASTTPSG
jgi:ribosomal protein L18